MSKDLHKKPFDDTTKAKLAIFKDYLIEWLPVFTKANTIYWNNINIYDFFAGPGFDSNGTPGTPVLIIEELKNHEKAIEEKNLTVNLYFNEFIENKNIVLRKNLLEDDDENIKPYNLRIDSLDFKIAFDNEYPNMGLKNNANLIFLDQYGIKHITADVFKKIINLKQTDFLFFISSSTIKRFVEHPSVIQYIKISPEEVEKTPYHKMHKLVLDYFKSLIPNNKIYYLSSFSLKKGSNIYGLIFGSGHELGIEKFIDTCWKLDPDRGEANYDIDEDNIIPTQLDIFTNEVKKPKKIDSFEKELREKILDKTLQTDKDIYLFRILNGFRSSHVKPVIKKLMDEKKIAKCNLILNNKICKADASLSYIKLL